MTLTDNDNGTATLAGTPAAGSGGSYSLTLTANNGVLPNGTQTFTLTVDEAPNDHQRRSHDIHRGDRGNVHGDDGHCVPGTPGAVRDGLAAERRDVHRTTATARRRSRARRRRERGGTYSLTFTANNGVSPNATQSLHAHGRRGTHDHQRRGHDVHRGHGGHVHGDDATAFPTAGAVPRPARLPSGVTFTDNGNGTATLAGTPAAGTGGTYSFTSDGQ